MDKQKTNNSTIAFYDLGALVVDEDKSLLSDRQEAGKWEVVPYETYAFSGKMLCVGESVFPRPVTLELGVNGWHKIYFGFISMTPNHRTEITLGKLGKNVLDMPPVYTWDPQGQLAEVYVRSGELTGVRLTIGKPEGFPIASSGLAYVRLEKMTEEEIRDYEQTTGGVVNYHFDEDYYGESRYENPQEFIGKIGMLGGSGGGILFHETTSEGTVFGQGNYGETYMELIRRRNALSQYFHQNKAQIKPLILQTAKQLGYTVYATKRIQVGDFLMPLTREMLDSFVLNGNEEYRIETRDGRKLTALSYAYEKVRKMSVQSLIESMDDEAYGGVSLTFHRGVFVGFEKPVRERVRELYGIEAWRLPASDARLHSVWGEYLTEYLRELKKAMAEKFGENTKKINVILFADPVSSKNNGFDVETWAEEGLIDSVSQGLMAWYEDLTGCLDENGLIVMERYQKERGQREIIQRFYDGWNLNAFVEGAKAYLPLCERYGVEFFATLGWDNATVENTYKHAKMLKEIGVKKLFSWNADHKARKPHLLNAERDISRAFTSGEIAEKPTHTIYRVLSVGEKDLSEFNVNWNG